MGLWGWPILRHGVNYFIVWINHESQGRRTGCIISYGEEAAAVIDSLVAYLAHQRGRWV
jgi:hypothetical protein